MNRDVFKPHSERTEQLAYELWEKRGRPLWSSSEDWFEAERELSTHADGPPQLRLAALHTGPEAS